MKPEDAKTKIISLEQLLSECKSLINNQPGDISFDQWLRKESYPVRGLRKDNRYKLAEGLKILKTDTKAMPILDSSIVSKLSKKETTILALQKAVQKWRDQTTPDSINNRSYYAYFFYNHNKEPQFGRCILNIEEKGEVKFTNVPDGFSKEYTGTVTHIHEDVFFFELNTKAKDRSLHIKVYSSDTNKDTILLGAYITYEENHIVHGSIILESINEKNKGKEAATISYTENREWLEEIDISIRKYLSQKNHNYSKVKRKIFHLEHLNKFLLGEYREKKSGRFIETSNRPQLLISLPTQSDLLSGSSTNRPSKITSIVKKLEKKFLTQIEFLNFENQISFSRKEMGLIPQSLKSLTHTRFFILFYTHPQIASFTLVQLGWALAHCKKIIVVYEEGSLSENTKRLNNVGVSFYSFTNLSDKKEINDIFEFVSGEIEMSLGNTLF